MVYHTRPEPKIEDKWTKTEDGKQSGKDSQWGHSGAMGNVL